MKSPRRKTLAGYYIGAAVAMFLGMLMFANDFPTMVVVVLLCINATLIGAVLYEDS